MRFAKTLRNSTYKPWEGNYIDYTKLKNLLREHDPQETDDNESAWTEKDEGAFVEELVNVQLEKVHAFQANTYKYLRERTSECESKLEELASHSPDEFKNGEEEATDDQLGRENILRAASTELDAITHEINELEKYSRINFTGFLKAAKKHDRRRGTGYRVRPLLQVRLAALPFNSEDYSPLLYRLGIQICSDSITSSQTDL